jgi:hypothetical protein
MKFFTGRILRSSIVLCQLFTAAAMTESGAKSEIRKVWAEATECDWMSAATFAWLVLDDRLLHDPGILPPRVPSRYAGWSAQTVFGRS